MGCHLSTDAADSWVTVRPPGESPVVLLTGGRLWAESEGMLFSSAEGGEWREEHSVGGLLFGGADRPGKPGFRYWASVRAGDAASEIFVTEDLP